MVTLVRMMVEGFRGFREAREFTFENSVTQMIGDNRTCKSSGLNAVEWAIFGDACSGQQTGMRERIGWVIPNQHMPAPRVCVELELEAPEGTYHICRRLHKVGKKQVESLELTLPDGTTLAGDEAEEHLAGRLQSSFRDFLTTVYQHQEAIRAILTQEPRERNDALDRLLGLSRQRNFLGAIDEANLASRQKKETSQRFADFEQEIQTALRSRENDLARLRQEAKDLGLAVNQLTAKAALDMARATVRAVEQFAKEAELAAPKLEVPEQWQGLVLFDRSARKVISDLRGQVPGIAEQQTLLAFKNKLLTIQSSLESAWQLGIELANQVQDLNQQHGSQKVVVAKIAQLKESLEAEQGRLRQTSGRGAVVREAIRFVEAADGENVPCPVCGNEVPDLLDGLRRLWESQIQALVERITGKIDDLKAGLQELQLLVARYHKLATEMQQLRQEQVGLRALAGRLLNRELTEDDDPVAAVKAELKHAECRLQRLQKAIVERQHRLDVVTEDLDKVKLAHNYLDQENKTRILENIQDSEAYQELEKNRDQIAELVEDAVAIKDAVAATARDEAEAKLTAAETTIDKYFRQLSRNPAIEHLKLAITTDKRTLRNAYDITDQDGNDLTPILSQGDLNALALAIFLGLAASAGENATFGFVLLDDPSQSMGTEHKKYLAELLDQVAKHKKLIVATMDMEFHQYLCDSLTRSSKEYRFGKWTPEKGPSISAGPPSTLGRSSNKCMADARR